MNQSCGLCFIFLASYYARCALICANVDGITRRMKRSPDIRCRIENCLQSSRRAGLIMIRGMVSPGVRG